MQDLHSESGSIPSRNTKEKETLPSAYIYIYRERMKNKGGKSLKAERLLSNQGKLPNGTIPWLSSTRRNRLPGVPFLSRQ